MNSTLEPTSATAALAAPGGNRGAAHDAAIAEFEQALDAVDLTFHFGALILRAVLYLGLAAIASTYDFGPHLLAGVLFGDFSAYAATSLRAFRTAPVAAGAELLLFSTLFALWWWNYAFPQSQEFRALFLLGGFGAMVARAGMALGKREPSIYD
ncbi:MAG: hypothetical protein AB7O97_03465 [Planctomycetota bacterium]